MEAPPTGSGLSVHPGFWMGTGGGVTGTPKPEVDPELPYCVLPTTILPMGGGRVALGGETRSGWVGEGVGTHGPTVCRPSFGSGENSAGQRSQRPRGHWNASLGSGSKSRGQGSGSSIKVTHGPTVCTWGPRWVGRSG